MIDVLQANNIEHAPILATHGSCGGPLTRDCFDKILQNLKDRLLCIPKLDGILLALHGSMAAEDEPDGESEILECIQRYTSINIPIGVSLDLHGHITERMVKQNVFFVGYKTYPHVDMYTTGEKTANILVSALKDKIVPKMSLSKLPLIISPVIGRTDEGPMKEVYDGIVNYEKNADILDVSCFMVQPWLDFSDLGFATTVCSNNNEEKGEQISKSICDKVWEIRNNLIPDLIPLEESIKRALSNDGTTVIGDCGDAPSAGGVGDNVTILKKLIELGLDKLNKRIFLTLVDPEAANVASKSGVGTELNLKLGHHYSKNEGTPIISKVRVKTISDGSFKIKHGLEGAEMQFGLTALVTIGAISVAIRSYGGFEWDIGQYTSIGLNLDEASIIFVKSPAHFRTAYDPYADEILIADTPGASRCNIEKIPYKYLSLPVHPLDKI